MTAKRDMRTIQDLWVDGLVRVEILDDVARTIYWKWALLDGVWQKVPVEYAVLRPLSSFPISPREWPGALVVERERPMH